MRNRTLAALTAGLVITGVTVSSVASAEVRRYVPASAVNVTAPAPAPVAVRPPVAVSQSSRVCADFSAWEAKRATRNLDVLMTASETVRWAWLGYDVTRLYTDVSEVAPYFVARDVKYVARDCR
jgi:hypothetical protein